MKNVRIPWRLPAVAAATALLFFGGCNNDQTANDPANNPKPSATNNSRREKVEPMDESSGELVRRHIFDELDREVETQISYRNGESATYYYTGDGKPREYVLRAKNGDVKQRKVYDTDGKTVIAGKESRSDGTTLWTMEKLPDGSTKTVNYWYDGKRVFSIEIRKSDGTVETSYFRKSGKIWAKRTSKDGKTLVEEQFDRSGVQTVRIETPNDKTSIVTIYDGGKPQARQIWKVEPNSWGGSSQTLQQVEEFDSTGRVSRKVTMNDSGWDAKQTETFNPDGTRTVRTMRSDGYVGKEETFDKAGKSTSSKEFKDDEKISETVDRQLFRRTYPDDPKSSWQLQESYPYYRDRDE